MTSIDAGRIAVTEARRRDRNHLLLLCALWVLAVILVDPRGEFPTTDDWAYAGSVRAIVEQGRLHYSNWVAGNIITHLLWGALFAWPLGASYFVLRLSTIVAALLGAIALYRLLRLDRADPSVALIGAAVFLFNPLCMALSFGFMSDIGYTAAQIGALLLLAAGARLGSRWRSALGWLLGLVALLSRQIGLAIPVGWAAGKWLAHPTFAPARLARLALPIVAFVAVQIAFQTWLKASGHAAGQFGRNGEGMVDRLLGQPLASAALALKLLRHGFYYFGVLLLPLLVAVLPAWLESRQGREVRVAQASLLLGLAVAIALTAVTHARFPSWSDTLLRTGIGPDNAGVLTPRPVIALLTFAAMGGGAIVVALIADVMAGHIRRRGTGERIDIPAAAGVTALVILLVIMLIDMRFDRYFIPLIPCVEMICVAAVRDRPLSRPGIRAAAIAVAAMGLFSTLAVHDAVATKRVKQAMYEEVIRRVPADRVDGGWTLNGATLYGKVGNQRDLESWLTSPDYLVVTAYFPRPGYVTIAQRPVPRWLPWGRTTLPVTVQRRKKPPGAG